MKQRILFVDDEESLLRALQRSLRSMRDEWEMEFVKNGQEGLDLLSSKPCNVVVSDMRMPKMDGAQFLTEVMNRHPETVRIVLSGQTQMEALVRSVGAAHQFISKPVDSDTLKAVVSRAFRLRDLLQDADLKNLLSRLQTLPSLPTNYVMITQELSSDDPSIRRVGEIVARDMGMAAKILQLVNSLVCGTRVKVTDPVQATIYIGVEMIKALVLTTDVFSQFEQHDLARLQLQELWEHSVEVGKYSRLIAEAENLEKSSIECAFIAGLLHDVGKVILAANMPEIYSQARDLETQDGLGPCDAERQVFRATHADIGAYLIGIWGLPERTFEAVLHHHRPGERTEPGFGVVPAVSVANAISRGIGGDGADGLNGDDLDWLEGIGLADRLEHWRQICTDSKNGQNDVQ